MILTKPHIATTVGMGIRQEVMQQVYPENPTNETSNLNNVLGILFIEETEDYLEDLRFISKQDAIQSTL